MFFNIMMTDKSINHRDGVAEELSSMKDLCQRIRGTIHPSLAWDWDSRFQVARMVLTLGQSKDVYSFILKEFAENWVAESLPQAPDLVQHLADQIFGLRHGQLLFTLNSRTHIIMFAAWWPWEDGQNISLRIGMRPVEGSKYTEADIEKMLREWFSISN